MKLAARRVARELATALDDPTHADWPQVAKRCLLMLALPKRKVRVKDSARAARRTTVKELDAMARAIVFARDGEKCRRCGKPAVDWSHVYTRGIHAVRWDLDGSFASCKGCHLWWHRHPADAATWWEGEIGLGRMADLSIRANGKRGRTNHALVRLHLEAEAKKLGISPTTKETQ